MIKVMDSDGLVAESAMINALEDLGNARARGDQRIDAISMSFGYYHEADGRGQDRLPAPSSRASGHRRS